MLGCLRREQPTDNRLVASLVTSTLPASPAKLQPPTARRPVVARERLLALRPDPAAAPTVTVIAPAGYGKSTLLHSWVDDVDVPVVWLSLDRRDDDPVTLATNIALAVLRTWPSASAIEEALEAPTASIWSLLMPRLSAELASRSPFLQVIDDVHELSDPECLDVLSWLALQVPAGSQLALAGRRVAGLAMPRLHLEQRIAEIGVDELRLNDDEAVELLRGSGLEVTAEQGAQLNRACEGWIAGLLLSTMGDPAHAHGQQPPFPARGPGLIGQYIHSEVLSRMSREEVDFLVQTSVLRELTAPLCDAVLERTGSAVLLDRLCDSNAFISRVQGDRCRYHDLFREALATELTRVDSALAATLRRRAAEWTGRNGDSVEAVSYAIESGDDEMATRLIAAFAQPTFNAGRTLTVRRWLDWAEESERVRRDPILAMSGYFVMAMGGEAERADFWARSVDDAAAGGTDQSSGASALLSAAACRAGAAAALVDAYRACEMFGTGSPWRRAALTTLGVCQMMNGRSDESEAAFLEVVAGPPPQDTDANARSIAYALLARGRLDAGDLEGARRHLEAAARLRARQGIVGQGMQAMIDALLARLAITADARSPLGSVVPCPCPDGATAADVGSSGPGAGRPPRPGPGTARPGRRRRRPPSPARGQRHPSASTQAGRAGRGDEPAAGRGLDSPRNRIGSAGPDRRGASSGALAGDPSLVPGGR